MELYEAYLRHPHISTDSRQATQGTLFFALRGDSFDGNRYAASALEAGAAAAVLDNPEVYKTLTEEQRSRCYLVPDTLEALQQLAAHHRRQLGIPIFAITGSNGKTTTKELTYRVLSCRFHTYATHGNLNNHIGVPLTLLSMDRSTEFGNFYRFETLTLVPYEKDLIDIDLLTDEEINQINCYHEVVRERLSQYLEGEALGYLERASSPIVR